MVELFVTQYFEDSFYLCVHVWRSKFTENVFLANCVIQPIKPWHDYGDNLWCIPISASLSPRKFARCIIQLMVEHVRNTYVSGRRNFGKSVGYTIGYGDWDTDAVIVKDRVKRLKVKDIKRALSEAFFSNKLGLDSQIHVRKSTLGRELPLDCGIINEDWYTVTETFACIDLYPGPIDIPIHLPLENADKKYMDLFLTTLDLIDSSGSHFVVRKRYDSIEN